MAKSVISYQSGPLATVTMGLPGDHEGKTATRVFFVHGTERIALIDSGIYAGLPVLEQAFDELGMMRRDLDLLLLTHEHMDHVGNNGWLKTETGCEIIGHEARADRVADNMLNAKTIVHAFPEGEHFDLNEEYLDWMGPTEGPIDSYVEDGNEIDLGGGVALEVIEVFGHSMGEIGFFEHSTRSLIIADPLLPDFNPVLYLYEDPNTMRATFDKLERFLTERDVQSVLLAHDEVRSASEARALVADCRARMNQVEVSMVAHMKASPGIGFAQLRDNCCDDQGKVHEWRALVSIDASLKDFVARGLAENRNGGWHYVG
ncbi:MAG: MBL fold metallo-hydrolase [Rhodobacteraceae bacterium]|nr:MBL fold metallo-hydrolase [Paracoccaceae bacterium]